MTTPVTPKIPAASAPVGDAWEGLRTLVRARLLVATLALPLGVLLRPDGADLVRAVLWWSMLALGALSVLFWAGTRWRRGLGIQTALQLGADLGLVTWMAAVTGGRDSQFVLFLALVVITGGVLGRMPGGLLTAIGACAAFLALPAIAGRVTGVVVASDPASPRPALLIAFFLMTGILAGFLGERAGRTRADLARTARELDRVRVDNDVILRHLTTGVLTASGEGRVAYLNPAAEQMLGLRALEVRGQKIEDALPERLRPLRDVLQESLDQRARRARVELMLKTATGRALPAGLSTNPLTHDEGVHGVVAVFQDLTEVREMERRARRNQTLAELGALSAGIAHELRNGLNPISGSAECLQRELKLEGENAVLMELIVKECSRLNRFVTDLLNYSKERDLAPSTVDLEPVLAELVDGLRRDPRCTSRIEVRLEPPAERVAVQGDHEMLRQVWLNLGANALEAMTEGGTLVVRWKGVEPDQVMVEFEDTGSGIAEDDLPRVSQPFFTTKKGGTGLGLAIAQRIVERHGGALTLESTPGRVTVARVTLAGATTVSMLAA